MDVIIGRKEEIRLLKEAFQSKEASLVAIYGRRRVGKTFLIHNHYKDYIVFELAGMYGASLKQQLQQFSRSLQTTRLLK
jgi:AAA+ ATPase superfamily predicted ATPase